MNPSSTTPEIAENADAEAGAVQAADSGQGQALETASDGVGAYDTTDVGGDP